MYEYKEKKKKKKYVIIIIIIISRIRLPSTLKRKEYDIVIKYENFKI